MIVGWVQITVCKLMVLGLRDCMVGLDAEKIKIIIMGVNTPKAVWGVCK